jgi:hypothetical protein
VLRAIFGAGASLAVLSSTAATAFAAIDPLPITPLRVTSSDGARVLIALRADGIIVDAHGARLGKIEGATLTFERGLEPLWTVDPSGGVTCSFFRAEARFDADDVLVIEAHGSRERIWIDDAGAVVREDRSGRHSMPLRAAAVTGRSRRTALLLALSLDALDRAGPSRPPRRVTLTIDVARAVSLYFDVASELRFDRRLSLTMNAGGGARALDIGTSATTLAWEIGLQPRWYAIGNFQNGLYLGWSTRFARERVGPVGFESLWTPPGLSTGGVVGFKSTDVPIITPDFSVGLMVPVVTPGAEVTHPPIALVARLGVGVSF